MSNISELIKKFNELKVKELLDFVDAAEKEWGVSAAAPAGQVVAVAEEAKEEQTEFELILKAVAADKKTTAIKALRGISPDLSLMDAKAKVEEVMAGKAFTIGKFDKNKSGEIAKQLNDELGANSASIV